jgi:hypothetical protein
MIALRKCVKSWISIGLQAVTLTSGINQGEITGNSKLSYHHHHHRRPAYWEDRATLVKTSSIHNHFDWLATHAGLSLQYVASLLFKYASAVPFKRITNAWWATAMLDLGGAADTGGHKACLSPIRVDANQTRNGSLQTRVWTNAQIRRPIRPCVLSALMNWKAHRPKASPCWRCPWCGSDDLVIYPCYPISVHLYEYSHLEVGTYCCIWITSSSFGRRVMILKLEAYKEASLLAATVRTKPSNIFYMKYTISKLFSPNRNTIPRS